MQKTKIQSQVPDVISRHIKVLLGVLLLITVNALFSFSEEVRYDSGNRRDPFVPVKQQQTLGQAGGKTDIIIEGIIYDPHGKSMVIVRDEPYLVGDSIGTQKIIEIFQKKIVTLSDGQQSEYWISSDDRPMNQDQKIGLRNENKF